MTPFRHDTAALAREFLDAGFEATLVCVDPCGENGEFHTFVSAGPIFVTPTACETGEIVEREGFVFCDLTPA